MIASLRGTVAAKDASGVVVDCGGVGYGLSMSLSSLERLGSTGSSVELLVHTHVTQDNLRLYGFVDISEKRCFELLIGITGVGPKLALAILSTFSTDELAAVVARADVSALVRIPGVGKKTAERLLLELKSRLPKSTISLSGSAVLREDLVSALTNLGFSAGAAEKAADAAMHKANGDGDIATLVRAALRATTKA